MLVTTDESLKAYLVNVLQQINDWMMSKMLQKLVLVITAVGSKEVLERWVFDIEQEEAVDEDGTATKEKPAKEISQEISAIIRQITASVTFLPLLEEACTFDLLVYTNAGERRAGGVGGERREVHREQRRTGQAQVLLHLRAQG